MKNVSDICPYCGNKLINKNEKIENSNKFIHVGLFCMKCDKWILMACVDRNISIYNKTLNQKINKNNLPTNEQLIELIENIINCEDINRKNQLLKELEEQVNYIKNVCDLVLWMLKVGWSSEKIVRELLSNTR